MVVAGLAAGAYLSSYIFDRLISWASRWARSGEGDTDVMVTVDALKTTNKELKKQYGKINLDKSMFPFSSGLQTASRMLWEWSGVFSLLTCLGLVEQLQDEMADLMDVCLSLIQLDLY